MSLADIVLRRSVDLSNVIKPCDEFTLLFGDYLMARMIDLDQKLYEHLSMFPECFYFSDYALIIAIVMARGQPSSVSKV